MGDFVLPDKGAREAAVGSLAGMEPSFRRCFQAGEDFELKREPDLGDWLFHHEEPGQTVREYLDSQPNKVGANGRSKLHILPLGEFPKETSPDLQELKKYMELYYAPMVVEILPIIPAEEVPAVTRENLSSGKLQWNSSHLLGALRGQVPRDSYGLIAVTMTDLYPEEGWNFVFGQASYKNRVGIFSFARYHPAFTGEEGEGDAARLVQQRASKVLTHEMGHMFGIKHCIYYQCNMNGVNSLPECDATPMHLCPVCLRKLQRAVGFDPLSRYQELEKFYRQHQLLPEADWVKGRVDWIAQ
ncbi:archaemetzincin [Roseibacillus persicicus]|uniref:Archaemetzincin n=1 Tax=Roseibacillus persicicus TaxID=454148 RepID=A0A918TSK9_9BACT|nr:archaemetzincin [Roseibacillus persicicus]GHC61477.1 hypothetical protein GCM10007100_31010 [Roseibacillus persicicus]